MGTMTIPNVSDDVQEAWRQKAAQNGMTVEEALRQVVSEHVRPAGEPDSKIGAEEILRRARDLRNDPPVDERYRFLTSKELSDAISGEFDDL